MANPCPRKWQSVFVAALRHEIEVAVCPDRRLTAARVSRISVKDVAVLVFIEHANPWRFLAWKFGHLVVVRHLTLGHFFLGERHVEVAIEISPERRHPVEAPAHALLEFFDLRQRSSRYREKRDVPLSQVHQRAVGMIHVERAARAAFFPLRTKHEVVYDQLASALE